MPRQMARSGNATAKSTYLRDTVAPFRRGSESGRQVAGLPLPQPADEQRQRAPADQPHSGAEQRAEHLKVDSENPQCDQRGEGIEGTDQTKVAARPRA